MTRHACERYAERFGVEPDVAADAILYLWSGGVDNSASDGSLRRLLSNGATCVVKGDMVVTVIGSAASFAYRERIRRAIKPFNTSGRKQKEPQ